MHARVGSEWHPRHNEKDLRFAFQKEHSQSRLEDGLKGGPSERTQTSYPTQVTDTEAGENERGKAE